MTKEKKVSIIIRTKNEEQWIEMCLRKIYEQTYKNFEIIIVDNLSKDKTLEKIKNYKCKIVKIDKFIPGKAINIGISKSSGEIIVCLSAHCIPVDKYWLKNLVLDLNKKNIGAVYGKQLPLPYSSPLDKRDLYNTFGEEKRIQSKDTFFHNANSAFKRNIWNKIKFDERILHIEDRVWAHEILKLGYKIVYQPKSEVYHWHGINQSLDLKRCEEIVSILENLSYVARKKPDLIKLKNLKCAAVIPLLGKTIGIKEKNLLELTINQLKKSKMIDDIYLYSNEKENKKISKKLGIDISINRENTNSQYYLDIISSVRNFLEKVEKKGKFYDLLVIATENFPLRNFKIFDEMIKLSINKNYDVVVPVQPFKGSIFSKENLKIKTLVNGTIPSKINNNTFSRIGISTVIKTSKIRSTDIMKNKLGFYNVKDQMSFIEINKDSLKKLDILSILKF
tara:strand:+ start:12351 stop:13700 length:1350 start_codon:yes stop_codon:yes gene_type:complete